VRLAIEPFLIRALAAGIGLAVIAAPLGCFLVWQRMAFFGETVAQASLIGVALALALDLDVTATVLIASIAVALLLLALGRQKIVPVDTLLSLLAHASLAIGVLATALVKGRSIDLISFLFGDILAVTRDDLLWIAVCGVGVLATLAWLWRPLLSIAVHEELAAAEGVARARVQAIFVILLAVVIAMAMKIVGVLLISALLVTPAVIARMVTDSFARMLVIAPLVGAACGAVPAGRRPRRIDERSRRRPG
jgi:zinc transport system permease protein